MPDGDLPATKAAAKAAGLSRYFTGKPCRRGHVSERYLGGSCVACTKQAAAAWSAENSEQKAAVRKVWLEANKDRQRGYTRAWRERYPEKQAKAVEVCRERRPGLHEAQKQAWKKANPEKLRVYTQNRRNKLAGKLSQDIVDQLLRRQRGRCACPCQQPLVGGFHLDHIQALKHQGRNTDSNMQLLTPDCNLRKGTKNNAQFFEEQRARLKGKHADT